MTRVTSFNTSEDDSRQALYARIWRLQRRTNKNRLRLLQIGTQLDRVRKLTIKDPDYTPAEKVIPQLEKMLDLARAVHEYDRAVLNNLWRHVE
jgi:hypothetical protein